jgi:2-dehydropantoate 2-reductase
MRFLIYGAGAIGCLQGGFLARAGNSVVLYGRESRMCRIAAEGLFIDGIFGEFHLPTLETSWELSQLRDHCFDVILFCVKAYDTHTCLDDLEALTKDRTLVVSLQNGLGNVEQIASRIGGDRTIAGRIITGVVMPEPNRLTVTVTADAIRIGPLAGAGAMPRCEEIAQALRLAGLPTEASSEVMQYLWAKVLYNSALNPLSAILNRTYGELGANSYTRSVMDQVIEEGFLAAGAAGVRLFWEHPEEYREVFYGTEVPLTSAHRSSMLQSMEMGKRTEIDALNGALVRIAEQHGFLLPVNQTLTQIIKAKEGHQRESLPNFTF